jgi:hypothetical protein
MVFLLRWFIRIDGYGKIRADQLTQPATDATTPVSPCWQHMALGIEATGRFNSFPGAGFDADATALAIGWV